MKRTTISIGNDKRKLQLCKYLPPPDSHQISMLIIVSHLVPSHDERITCGKCGGCWKVPLNKCYYSVQRLAISGSPVFYGPSIVTRVYISPEWSYESVMGWEVRGGADVTLFQQGYQTINVHLQECDTQ